MRVRVRWHGAVRYQRSVSIFKHSSSQFCVPILQYEVFWYFGMTLIDGVRRLAGAHIMHTERRVV